MFQRFVAPGALLLLAATLVVGCDKSPTSPGNTPAGDAGQVSATLVSAATLVDDPLAESTVQVAASAQPGPAGGAAILAAIKPFAWWQSISNETINWTFAWADTDSTGRPQTCVATETKHMTGSLDIVPVSPTDSTMADTSTISKPLDKTLTRRVLLKRIPLGGARVWRVVMVTGAFVTTPGATTNILSLRMQSTSGVDTTITDPLQWHALRHIVKFGATDTVTVTVTTSRNTDAVFIHRWDWRHRMRDNLDGTYSFSWVTSPWGGWRYFAVQAMTHNSIYDDTAPFDSQAWHMPFRVVGGQADVDYYP